MIKEDQLFEMLTNHTQVAMKPILKSVEMIKHHSYKVERARRVRTQWGLKLLFDLGEHVYFMPDHFNELFGKDEKLDIEPRNIYVTLTDLNEKNGRVYPTLKIERILPNGDRLE